MQSRIQSKVRTLAHECLLPRNKIIFDIDVAGRTCQYLLPPVWLRLQDDHSNQRALVNPMARTANGQLHTTYRAEFHRTA